MIFVGGFLVVRILTKEEYGTYTYILNIFSIFTLLGDLGISASVLQYGTVYYMNNEKRKAYIRYGRKVIWFTSLLSVALIFFISYMYKFNIQNAGSLFRLLLLLPIFNNEILYFQSVLRIELRNKEYARINILSTAIHYTALIGMAFLAGVKGAIFAAYPETAIVLVVYIITVNPQIYQGNGNLSRQEKRDFWRFAILMQLNQTSLALLNYLDIYCIGLMLNTQEIIAEYKVASTIPTALYFIPKSIMFFIVPIMGRKKSDIEWTKSTLKKLVFINALLCGVVAIIVALLSKYIINIVYGQQYADSRMCFLVLLIGFVIYGALQCPASNILSIQEKLNVLFFTSAAGVALNIILNIWMIHMAGAVGAAIATVSSHLFIGIVLIYYLWLLLNKRNG